MPLTNAGKIGISWAVLVVFGLGAFVVSKTIIDQKRYDSMKVRERIRNANAGQYEYPKHFDNK